MKVKEDSVPNIKSAKKRARQAEKQKMRNRSLKTYMRNLIKKTQLILEDENTTQEEAQKALNYFKSKVDKAWIKGIYKRNKSSRLKSNMENAYKTKYESSEQ